MITLLDLDGIYLFGLLLGRASGFVLTAPFFGERLVPRVVKALLVGALALLMLPLVTQRPPTPEALSAMVLAAAGEILLGVAMGFVARLLFMAFEMAGHIVSFQMGFAMAAVVDPMQPQRQTLMARWLWMAGMTLFLTLGGHHHLLRALRHSLETLPPGVGGMGLDAVAALTRFSADALVAALQVAAPAVGILLLTSMALGILARTVPQMNVFIVGFPIKITAGIVGVLWSLPYLIEVARREIGTLVHRIALLTQAA